jgi:hypothetical protein
MIIIQQIDFNDVVNKCKNRYNSNNHWINNERPDDYIDSVDRNNTSTWIDKYKKYIKIDIDSKYLYWMKKATEIGMSTGKFSKIYEEDLNDMLNELRNDTSSIFDGRKYFVRSENVSLKFGEHGVGPYTDLKSIIESSVSCIRGHSPINQYTKSLTYYLIEWVDMNDDLEFRMFIFNKKVTCISQQKLYKINHTLSEYTLEGIEIIINILLDYFETNIKNDILYPNYSIDISLINNIPYFIEVNSFGTEYAAGSALFHWIIDHNLLYSDGENVYFRYTF